MFDHNRRPHYDVTPLARPRDAGAAPKAPSREEFDALVAKVEALTARQDSMGIGTYSCHSPAAAAIYGQVDWLDTSLHPPEEIARARLWGRNVVIEALRATPIAALIAKKG